MHAETAETSLDSSTPVSIAKERRFKLSRWAIVSKSLILLAIETLI